MEHPGPWNIERMISETRNRFPFHPPQYTLSIFKTGRTLNLAFFSQEKEKNALARALACGHNDSLSRD